MDPSRIVLDALRTITGLTGGVYDGDVPDNIPANGKWVKPYAVLWAGPGGDVPFQKDLTGLTDPHGLDWRPQVTVAAADATTCRAASQAVRSALMNLPIGPGFLKPDDDLNRQLTPISDHTVTPARFYLPLRFRAITTQ